MEAQCGLPYTRGDWGAERLSVDYYSLEERREQRGSVWLTIHYRRAECKEAQLGLPFTRGKQRAG